MYGETFDRDRSIELTFAAPQFNNTDIPGMISVMYQMM